MINHRKTKDAAMNATRNIRRRRDAERRNRIIWASMPHVMLGALIAGLIAGPAAFILWTL